MGDSGRSRGARRVKLGHFAFAALLLVAVTTAGMTQSPAPSPPGGATPGLGPGIDPAGIAALAGDRPGTSTVGAAGPMIGFSHFDGSGTQTITLVHTGKSWMAVYHIDTSGKIRLVSSRPIDADFSLQLNATSPLPRDIRDMGRR